MIILINNFNWGNIYLWIYTYTVDTIKFEGVTQSNLLYKFTLYTDLQFHACRGFYDKARTQLNLSNQIFVPFKLFPLSPVKVIQILV